MANEIRIQKKVYDQKTFNRVIDRSFKTFVQPVDPVLVPTVDDFFQLYDSLYYEIPIEGDVNSHKFLVQRSSELINFEKDTTDIQPLLDEITILREQVLDLNAQLLEERINAANNP
tara:strand:+ start:767 stop:1114 length:348 start_codon:yes stop_codon:yes gene_type:complete